MHSGCSTQAVFREQERNEQPRQHQGQAQGADGASHGRRPWGTRPGRSARNESESKAEGGRFPSPSAEHLALTEKDAKSTHQITCHSRFTCLTCPREQHRLGTGHLAHEVGWKYQAVTATLEEKRKEKAKIHYRKKKQLMRLRKQAEKNTEKKIDKFTERGRKTSLKSRREQCLKVTSRKTGRRVAGALPARPLDGGAHKAGGRAGGREFGVRSHGAGLLEAQPSGERRLGNDGCSGPAAPSPEPPDPPPPPRPGSTALPPPPGRARPAPTRPPRTAAHWVPAPPHPRCQPNNASPTALLPLPADRLASSHLGRSRPERRISAGAERTRATSGATW
ncbi:hypothetical protein J1605_001883 [Eschrichtius robustus]|uniref:Uncharacterized protein n=1 Tax=Eschrichtius robustus TaxID=9764 RepID=A0AB34HY65_ESCRO|nr:hypothetical protein J1605_001883 [Eschrichtius robustus]